MEKPDLRVSDVVVGLILTALQLICEIAFDVRVGVDRRCSLLLNRVIVCVGIGLYGASSSNRCGGSHGSSTQPAKNASC